MLLLASPPASAVCIKCWYKLTIHLVSSGFCAFGIWANVTQQHAGSRQILQFTRTKMILVKDFWSISALHTHNYIPFPLLFFSTKICRLPCWKTPKHLKLFKGLSTRLINITSVPEERNYFTNIFQFLNFFISSWSTERPHHPNNKFNQLRNVKGPILCLLFYQIQIKNFCNLASQPSMARQQERQESLKRKVFSSILVLRIKDYKDQNSYWDTFYYN